MQSRILQVPLAAKLVGANALIALLALAAVFVDRGANPGAGRMLVVLGIALAIGLAVNLTLVAIALRPIQTLEAMAWRIWHGDSQARVPHSPVADAQLHQLGDTLNALLDHLDQDRARMHGLASEVIRAEDRERARIGRELHDSIAQALAGVTYQLTAAETACKDGSASEKIRAIRVQVGEILDQVDVLSHTVHPRVLNDLGLVAGLRHLARTVTTGPTTVEVVITEGTEDDLRGLGLETAAVLYRVTQEALQNALRHSRAAKILVAVGAAAGRVRLRVDDTGTGFDLAEAQRRRPGMGLFTMRERVALVNGEFAVETAPGKGTSVRVSIPVEVPSFPSASPSRAARASTSAY
jgi:signal transduction histidine kinase